MLQGEQGGGGGVGYRCAADRQLAKGLWVPGTLEAHGLAGVSWQASGLEDPQVRSKVEESVSKGLGLAADQSTNEEALSRALKIDIALEDIVGPPQRSKPPARPLMRLQAFLGKQRKKSSVVFRFLTDDSRDTIIDAVQPLLAKVRKPSGSSASQSDPFASVSGTNVKVKRKLLLKNEELGELYKQVVGSGAVTDQEFWMTKRKLLEKELSDETSVQKKGVSTSMLADVELTNDGKNFVINFKLTDEVKKHIFAEKPKVYQAFLANVPSKLSEKEFWTKYCKHLYYQKVNKKKRKQQSTSALITTSANAIQQAEEMEAVQELFTENQEDIRNTKESKRKKVSFVDPSIDLTADYHDGFSEGYGLRHNAAGVIGNTAGLETSALVKDLNRHAAVVVSNLPESVAGSSAAGAFARGEEEEEGKGKFKPHNNKPRAKAQVLDDLMKPREEGFETLKVQDLRQQHDCKNASSAGSSPGDATRVAQALIRNVRGAHARKPLTSAQEEKQILTELEKRNRLTESRNKMLKSAIEGSLDSSQFSETISKLRRTSQAVNELLRHFWASFPLSSQQRIEKVKRINVTLTSLYDGIEKTRSTLDANTRQFARPLIGPVLQACDAAFEKMDSSNVNIT